MMPSLGSYSWCKKRKRTGPNAIVPILGNQHQVDNADHSNQHQVDNADHSNCQGVDSAPVIIDLDTFDDDDIAISSPSAFAEAKNNIRRHRAQTVVIDLDSEGRSSCVAQTTCKKHMTRELVNALPYNKFENSNCKSLEKEKAITPKEPTFSCPICMGPLVEEMSTKCGHIFCKKCIKKAFATQKMCPTCRKKMTMRSVFRVYLPAITY